MENNPGLFGGLTVAQQKALGRLFLDAPPEAQLAVSIVGCGGAGLALALSGVGVWSVTGVVDGCEGVVGLSSIHDDKVRPWLRPFSEILLPEEDDDAPGDTESDDGTDTTDPQPEADDEERERVVEAQEQAARARYRRTKRMPSFRVSNAKGPKAAGALTGFGGSADERRELS